LFSVDDLLAEREEREGSKDEYVGAKRLKEQDLMGDIDMWESSQELSQAITEEGRRR
jgi:hypothetical protein